MAKKYKLRNSEHFYSTLEPKLQQLVLDKLKTAPPIHGKFIVDYDSEGFCIFEILVDTDELRHVEFLSTVK